MGFPLLAEELEGGIFITIYLAPTDYHRIHCPLAGKIIKSNHMGDDLYSVNLNAQTSIPLCTLKMKGPVWLFNQVDSLMDLLL